MSAPAELFARHRREPLWQVDVALSDTELALVRSPALVRLHRVRHAGAGWLTTGETGSRLQHVLGVHALAVHLVPQDAELRAAALLHDVGHLPLCHTLEGLVGLDHHAVGAGRFALIAPVLEAGGLDPVRVEALAFGIQPSPLKPGGERLGLDHLDGVVRCADAHGWLTQPPHALLSGVTLGTSVAADTATAATLARLALAGARWQRVPVNVGPVAAVRQLVTTLLAAGDATAGELSAWADDELWAALLASGATAAGTRRLLDEPWAIRVRPLEGDAAGGELVHTLGPPYLATAEGELPAAVRRELAAAAGLPRRFAIRWD